MNEVPTISPELKRLFAAEAERDQAIDELTKLRASVPLLIKGVERRGALLGISIHMLASIRADPKQASAENFGTDLEQFFNFVTTYLK